MDTATAARLQQRYGLIPREVSKRMVDALITGVPLDPPREEPLAPWRTRLSALPAPADDRAPFTPRNAAIYRLIKERYPEFRWEARRRVDSVKRRETGELIAIERRWVEFKNTPTIGALLPSLASLLVATIASDEPTPHEARKIAHCSEFRRGEDLARLLLEIGAVFPPDDVLRLVGAWWEAGLSGAPLVVFTPVCPDYAVEPTGDPELPYEYTFDSLGADVGLVARRIRAELPRLAKTFRDVGISVEFVVAIGDFEAGSPETLARVGLTRETFLARLAESQDRLRDTTTAPVTTPFITALCGEAAWSATVEEIHRRLRAGDFGAMPLVSPRRDLRHIVKARRRLYSRWFGERDTPEAFLPVLLRQGAEYAAIARVVRAAYPNALLLGADHAAMAAFMHFDALRPVVYLKRHY